MPFSYSDHRLRNLYYRLPVAAKEFLDLIYSFQQRTERFGGVFTVQLAEFERNAHRSADEIASDQLTRLRRLLIYAGENIPYYRQLFQSVGFKPGSLQSHSDLRQLPLLDKETVRQQRDQLVATPMVGHPVFTHTSGTTGKGLNLVISREAIQCSYACTWFHYSWAGIKRGDRIATLAGHPVAAPDSLRPPFWIHDRLENELLFSSQHITQDTLPLYADALANFMPVLVRGYPSSVYLLALHLLESKRTDIRPKAVYTSSETLLDFQRKAIETAFECKSYSYYGNTERVAHILECREGNFHVMTGMCVVEVLRPDGSPTAVGESGELVCTGLIDRMMPLIRYRIGDTGIAAVGPCACGLDTPILRQLTGRVEDIIITPDGRHVARLDHVFKDALNVREAQIIQDEINSITVRIVRREGFKQADLNIIEKELQLRLGHLIIIKYEFLEKIPRLPSGKYKFVMSCINTQIN